MHRFSSSTGLGNSRDYQGTDGRALNVREEDARGRSPLVEICDDPADRDHWWDSCELRALALAMDGGLACRCDTG